MARYKGKIFGEYIVCVENILTIGSMAPRIAANRRRRRQAPPRPPDRPTAREAPRAEKMANKLQTITRICVAKPGNVLTGSTDQIRFRTKADSGPRCVLPAAPMVPHGAPKVPKWFPQSGGTRPAKKYLLITRNDHFQIIEIRAAQKKKMRAIIQNPPCSRIFWQRIKG